MGSPSWAINTTGVLRAPNVSSHFDGSRITPVTPPGKKGRKAVRQIDSVAGVRKEKKRMPRCNDVDTGCVSHTDNITGRESGQTFPWSFTRENSRNRLRRQSK
jgi:hypothetical protein